MGGPHNFLGTGRLLNGSGTAFAPEDVTLGVNPYCTDKANGDRYQSGYDGGTCSGAVNDEYRADGYLYAIDVPAERTSGLEVWLYDARYEESPSTSNGMTEDGIDDERQSGAEPFTFALLGADDTPNEVADNPVVCTRTFTGTTPFEFTFLGSHRWNRMPCVISPSAAAGRYLLRVSNGGQATTPEADGSNQFGLVAAYAAAGTAPAAVLCDARQDPACPRISGLGTTSIKADILASVTRFFLAQVPAEEAGRVLQLSIFDPGEGGQALRVLAPTGANTWASVPFSWRSAGVGTGSGSQLDVRNNRFNGRTVDLAVDLTGYVPPADNEWWKIEYQFGSGGPVTDRTTWDATIADGGPSDLAGVVSAETALDGATAWLVRSGDAWPSASVPVEVTGPTTATYAFPSLPAGGYQVYVAAPSAGGLRSRWVGGAGDRATATTLVATGDGHPVSAPEVTLPAGSVLSGRVPDEGLGVAGATVRVMGLGELWFPRAQVVTGADGSWATPGLPPGSYEIQVVPPAGSDAPPRWYAAASTRSRATPVVVTAAEPWAGLDVDLAGTGSVSGLVTGPGDEPVAGTRVVLYGPEDTWVGSREVVTGADGRYVVTGVDPASYQVRFVPPTATGWGAVWFGGGASRTASAPVAVTASGSATDVDAQVGP